MYYSDIISSMSNDKKFKNYTNVNNLNEVLNKKVKHCMFRLDHDSYVCRK